MRRADAAVVVSRLFTNLINSILKREPFLSLSTDDAIQLLSVMTLVVISTKENRPLTRTQIAIQLSIPRTKVFRLLRVLAEHGRVQPAPSPNRPNETIYVANFDFYDEVVTPDLIQDWHVLATSAAHELADIRAALAPVPKRRRA